MQVKSWTLVLFTFIALATASLSEAAIVVDNTISGSVVNNFNSLATGNVAGLISQTGATYGERFSGQTLTEVGGFDVLSGTPSGPLTLLANSDINDNIGILAFGTNVIYGDLNATIGEGALTVLLGANTDVLGFDIVGTDGGTFTVQFFGVGGTALGSITQTATNSFFGFRATGGDAIRGFSITNTDPAGIGYDNVTFNQLPAGEVPEPATMTIWAIGAMGLAAAACRRRKLAS